MQGVDAWSGSHPPTTTLPFHGDMTKGRLCHVLAFFGHSKGPSSEPQIQWFYFFRVATICIFAETMSPTVFLVISPKPCRRCILWLFWKTIAETLFTTDIILCIVNMLVLSNFVESGLNSVWQHWMLYIVFEKYYKGLYCKSNGLGWFARFRIQFLPDHYNDPFLSSVCVCVSQSCTPKKYFHTNPLDPCFSWGSI